MSLMTMPHAEEFEGPGGEMMRADVVPPAALESLARAEIDVQIATAKRYPRSIQKFMQEARTVACLTPEVAQSCCYALPRDGKVIEGPSVRLAEIAAHCFGNFRAAARITEETGNFLVAQAVAIDLEKNNAVQIEVRRPITYKNGRRYNDSMITTTANAAVSIALRNAILKAIPAAFIQPIYREARKLAAGQGKSIEERRENVKEWIGSIGVRPDELFAFLKIGGWQDLNLEHMAVLAGIMTAIKDGETTADEAFRGHRPALEDNATPGAPQAPKAERLAEALERKTAEKGRGKPQPGPKAEPPPADDAWPAGRE